MSSVLILVIAIAIVVLGILVLKLHASLALLFAAMFVAICTTTADLEAYALRNDMDMAAKATKDFLKSTAPQRIANGFGNTCGKIGILIAMAAIIGKCMLESGSADRIVRSTLRVLGQARAGVAFVGSGFLLGIPVFFDTVFYLMVPLAKAMRLQTGKNYVLYILAIVAGGSMAHSLVPPTPGPLYVANELNVNLLTMIIAGCLVGVFTSSVGYLFIKWLNTRIEIPLRDDGDLEQLEQSIAKPDSQLPSLWLSLLPIVLPVILIAAGTATSTYFKNFKTQQAAAKQAAEEAGEEFEAEEPAAWLVSVRPTVSVLGNKNTALIIAAIIALLTLAWHKKGDRDEMSKSMQHALSGAGVIILITASGGAFGTSVQQSSVSTLIAEMEVLNTNLDQYDTDGDGVISAAEMKNSDMEANHLADLQKADEDNNGSVSADELTSSSQKKTIWRLLPIAFIVTTLVRTAQGSATVAMMTAVGLFAPLASGLTIHPVYLALAIGCGSKPVAWMADSGFWVICKMSGMTEAEALRTVTPLSIVMGLAGLTATIVGALIWPMGF